jgi:3-deoxy-D-manno-octulosonic-acid transferase
VVVVNGKISESSARGYRRLGRFIPGFPAGGVARFQVQDEVYAARLRGLGIPGSKIEVAGNLKFDNASIQDPAERRKRLRAAHGFPPDAPILVAGSTHPGEEPLLLDALRRLDGRGLGIRLVLAPRHPERIPELVELCRREGLDWGLRSAVAPGDPEVLLVDTLGELHNLYALADLAFVGGTLVPVGGHNLLEPASLGLPLVVGPHLDTVREMAAVLAEAGVLTVLPAGDPDSITETLLTLFRDPDARHRAAAGAARVIAANRGGVERAASAVAEVLGRKLP